MHRLNKIFSSPRHLKHREINLKRLKHEHAIAERPQPKYPPIIDTTVEGYARHERQLFYDKVKALPTAEEKLYEIACNHSYYERTYKMGSCASTYLGVPFQHYITRTHSMNGLPQSYSTRNVDEEYTAIKSELSDLVAAHFSTAWRQTKSNSVNDFLKEDKCGANLSNAIIALICKAFACNSSPHLIENAFDTHPQIRSYWFHDGFTSKRDELNRKNLCFQFIDDPACTVRIKKPLIPVVPFADPLCATPEVIDYNYHPSVSGIGFDKYYLTSVPGFWPGDECDFPLLQVYTFDRINNLARKLDHFDLKPIEDGFGTMSSFGWLNALATYQGFTTYHDVTYPIVGQTVVTNGQDWIFFVYQLNTMSFHSDLNTKDRRNLCWTSGRMKLFETIENGELKGINDDVYKNLLKLVLAKPDDRTDINLKPYLGNDTRSEEEIVEMRKAARKMYRNIKNYNFPQGEIPKWHHVYKRNKLATPSPWIRLE